MNELEQIGQFYKTDKAEIYSDNPASLGHDYINKFYYNFLKDKKSTYRNILEIGIHEGASHKMWRDFFPLATIYGIDNAEGFPIPESSERLNYLLADQTDEKTILKAYKDITFDMIIDDGSHQSHHIPVTFNFLFPKVMSGGYYIIEDLFAGFNREFREMEDINSCALYWLQSIRDNNPLSFYLTINEQNKLLEDIESIDFVDQLAIITKK